MITTRLYLDCRRSKPDEPAPLKLSLTKHKVRVLVPLNIQIVPGYWDPKTQTALHPYGHLNVLISQKRSYIDSLLFQWQVSGEIQELTLSEIKDLIKESIYGKEPEQQEDPDADDSFKNRFEYFKNRHSGRTKEIYAHTQKRIEAFIGEKTFKTLRFDDITVKWLKDFDAFMTPTSPSRNARNIHFRNIRAVFNDALDDEIITCYPFRKFKIRPERTRKRSLTVEDLRKLFTLKVEPYGEIYQDMFKLIFMLIGINTVDLYNLKKIETDSRIEYKRAKTHRLYSIKVEPEAKEIIERWKGKKGLLSITDRWVDHVSFRHNFNKALRLLGATRSGLGGKKSKGLFPEITSYWARHSWATIAASLDIPKETIAAALGHGGNTVTDIYIDFDQRKVDEANRKVIDWVLYGKC